MPIKIEIGKGVKKVLSRNTIAEVRKEFSKRGPVKVKQALVRDVIRGVSPVQGKGKFKKYSDSYKQTIKGKTTFRTVNGRVVPIKGRDTDYLNASRPTKAISPVNLRHTGEFIKSLKVTTTGGFFKTFRLLFDWRSFLADIHNRRGAGKSKVTRRILPTEKGERFNSRIQKTLIDELKKAVNIVAKRLS